VYGVPIWHRDRDYDTIARFTGLQLLEFARIVPAA